MDCDRGEGRAVPSREEGRTERGLAMIVEKRHRGLANTPRKGKRDIGQKEARVHRRVESIRRIGTDRGSVCPRITPTVTEKRELSLSLPGAGAHSKRDHYQKDTELQTSIQAMPHGLGKARDLK